MKGSTGPLALLVEVDAVELKIEKIQYSENILDKIRVLFLQCNVSLIILNERDQRYFDN